MLNWIRDKLRAWLAISMPVVEPPKPLYVNEQTLQKALVKFGENWLVPRKIGPPKLPANVVGNIQYDPKFDANGVGPPLAMDSAENAPAWAYLNEQNCGLGFPGYGYLAELTLRSEYRAPTETLATEMTREWLDITTKGKASVAKRKARGETVNDATIDNGQEDKIAQMEAAIEEFQIRDHCRKLAEVDGFFGRSQLFINVGATDDVNETPLIVDPATIKKGSLQGFKVIEPIWTSPYAYNAVDPTRPDFYKPRHWFVIGRRVHASRLLTFVSREVPDILKAAYNFGGISMSQLMEPYVFRWLRTNKSVSDLLHTFSIVVMKTNMQAVLSGGDGSDEDGMGLINRLKLFVQNRDNQGVLAIDKNSEEMEILNAALSGLDKLQAQSQEHMAAPSHMPLVKLTGITPAGLNADSEGEIQVWYDFVRAFQIFFFNKHLKHIFDIIQLHLFGAIDDSIGFEWRPLSSPTTKELSEIRKANGETDCAYITNSVVAPEEVRERLMADPQSGYDNLSGPAPTPPEQVNAEHGAGLEEEGKDADHGRSEESAEATHERTMQVEKVKAKAKGPKK